MLNYLTVLSGYTLLFMFVGVITNKMIDKLYDLNNQSIMKRADRINYNTACQLHKMIRDEETKIPKIIYNKFKLMNELKLRLLNKKI